MKYLNRNVFIKLVLAIFFIMAAAIFSESYAAGSAAPDVLVSCDRYVTDSKGIKRSEKVKTFTRAFWQIIEDRVPKKFPEDLRLQGIVLGDMHFANLGMYYDFKRAVVTTVINDLDDSGTNFIIGDLMKFLVYLKTIPKIDFKNGDVVDAYFEGLSGNPIEKIPTEILNKFDVKEDKDKGKNKKDTKDAKTGPVGDYNQYLSNKYKDSKKYAGEKLEKRTEVVQEKIEKEYLYPMRFKPSFKWVFQETSGSSIGMNRFLFFLRNTDDKDDKVSQGRQLIEFKMLKCSAASADLQQNLQANFRKVNQYLRRVLGSEVEDFIKSQEVVLINGDYYLRRFKQPNLINDLKITEQSEKDQQEYAEYFARYLGYIHSEQVKKTGYAKAVGSHKAFILDEAKKMTDAFFKK